MRIEAKVRRQSDSIVLTIPRKIKHLFRLKPNTPVQIKVNPDDLCIALIFPGSKYWKSAEEMTHDE